MFRPPPFICIHVCLRLKSFWPKPSELLSPPIRYQVSLSLGENSSEGFGHKFLSRRQTWIQMNGVGQNIYSMDLIPHARILHPFFWRWGMSRWAQFGFGQRQKVTYRTYHIYSGSRSPLVRVQYRCLLCNRGLTLHRSAKGEERDEGQLLPEGAWSHCGMYEADDGGNKGDR